MNDLCSGFEPQNYLKERCKKCFRPKDKHGEETSISLQNLKKERRRSWKVSGNNLDNGGPDDDDTEALSVSSYLSATSKGMSSTKSCESVNDTKSMVTAFSGSICDEQRAITPTETENEQIQSLKEEVAQLRELNDILKDEKAQWASRQRLQNSDQSESSLVSMLEDRLNQAENQIQDYRDENTVLKCELRELQETTFATSDEKLREKIKTTENLCDELMEENEQLKAEVKELQIEIEEMQDQYREEEIEEFRELQRDLEINAKNCRILQFKLRKAERQRECAEKEKEWVENKLEQVMDNSNLADDDTLDESLKCKLLERDLTVAKKVNELISEQLSAAETSRLKYEDEAFVCREVVREMETQRKWRESRNKNEKTLKRLTAELAENVPNLPEEELAKELKNALEREIDTRDHLKFTEDDLKETQLKLANAEFENQKLQMQLSKTSKMRPPMIRSASDGHAHLQLELAESTMQNLNSKIERLESTNEFLIKRISELENASNHGGKTAVQSKAGEFKLTPEVERDMTKMIATISELERKNLELTTQIKQIEIKTTKPNFVVPSGTTTIELRNEQEKRKILELQLNEMKATMFKSDNQKVITLATKIEQLNTQLQLANERCNNLHRKQVKEGETTYADDLKKKIEDLEKQLSEKIANCTVDEITGKVPTTDEIEQCCELLATVETQTNRICKQVEKMDSAQKDERRRSLSKESGATIIAELANVMMEMKSVHSQLDRIKNVNPTSSIKETPKKDNSADKKCSKCAQNEQTMDEQTNEISFYKKKNKDLTNQVLQTEDRWTIEIEKQRQIFEKELKTLSLRIADSKRQNDEYSELLESKSTTLIEKTRALEEQEERNKKLKSEVDILKKDIQEAETDKKCVKEFEIKYKKLESIFETEREKMNVERSRSKNELSSMKKIKDDVEEHLKKLNEEVKRNETTWKQEKSKLEREILSLKKQLPDESFMQESVSTPLNSIASDSSPIRRQGSEKMQILELKKQISILEKRIADADAALDDCKIQNAEQKDQLSKTQANWQKDKEAFQHKTRQSEKLRTVEIDAMQQKFSSRMRIMEDTNKSLHSQLVLARRERDSHKEALSNYEKTVGDERNNIKMREKNANESVEKVKDLHTKLAAKEEEIERLNTDLRLTKEARKADQILWNIDRARVRNEKIDNKDSLEIIRKQYRDCEAFYSKEMDRLNDKITEVTAEKNRQKNDAQKTVRDLREQIRVIEIEQKNLSQNKDNQQAVKELIESERERLQQVVHLNELQKLTRKYRLSSIIDQLAYVSETSRKTSRGENEPDGIRYIINQLTAVRDDEATSNLNSEDRAGSVLAEKMSNGYAPSVSDCGEGTYDNISQSSFSIRSVTSAPLRHAYRTANQQQTTSNNATVASVSTTVSEAEPYYSKPEKPPHINKRSFSTESSSGFDKYGRQIRRGLYHDPTSSNNLNVPGRKTSNEEYSMTRAASFDNRSQFSEDDHDESAARSRPNSAGTNILYRVRREELARGGQPSVKLMAKAFEAIDEPKPDKRGFFGIRKSRSVETTQNGRQRKFEEAANTALMHSLGQVEEGVSSNYATLPRGGRNPFKNMGSRLVERVRRSLSRSSRQSRESDREDDKEVEVHVFKPEVQIQKPKPVSSPKKTKKKSAESKARKTSINVLS